MKKSISIILISGFILLFCNTVNAQSTAASPAKLSKKWHNLLDEQFSNWDKFLGVPHYSIQNLPDYLKGDGMKGTPIGLNKDPLNVFTVIKEKNEPVLYISGQMYGGLSTKEEYGDYHLNVQFKWGEKKYEPRLKSLRDNGILYHCCSEHGKFWNVWMNSIEFQIQENEMGDLYALSGRPLRANASQDKDSVWVYSPKSGLVEFGGGMPAGTKKRGRCKAIQHLEKPNGEWNTLELICLGDMSLHVVNGVVVNVIHEDTKTAVAGGAKYLRKGKIQLQCEGAEAYYKDIKIKAITKIPKQYLKQL